MITQERFEELQAENERLREALEEVCRCHICRGYAAGPYACENCHGTGRDYHGSAKAREVMEEKR